MVQWCKKTKWCLLVIWHGKLYLILSPCHDDGFSTESSLKSAATNRDLSWLAFYSVCFHFMRILGLSQLYRLFWYPFKQKETTHHIHSHFRNWCLLIALCTHAPLLFCFSALSFYSHPLPPMTTFPIVVGFPYSFPFQRFIHSKVYL